MNAIKVAVIFLGFLAICNVEAKKKKKTKEKFVKTRQDPLSSKVLNCLVCKSVIEELQYAINSVDPNKKVEQGSYRLTSEGDTQRKLVPYARSEGHLNEVMEKVCQNFEDYAMGNEKATGQPTIIRIMTREGTMNPRFGEVDALPDEDMNSKLKFYCETILETYEDDLLDMFKGEAKDDLDLQQKLCVQRSKLCPSLGKTEL